VIQAVKTGVADDPVAQVWKYLRLFLDVPSAAERIRAEQTVPERYAADVKKQARQLAQCIKQAEEYFAAASHVGLATRPTLLYYGAVALSRALILLKLDGTHSFDALRQRERHAHHGLNLNRGLVHSIRPADGITKLLSTLECSCNTNKALTPPIPWGHFSLFYQATSPGAVAVDVQIHDDGKQGWLERKVPLQCTEVPPLESLIGRSFNVLGIVRTLPDMYFMLHEMGTRPELCRGNYNFVATQFYAGSTVVQTKEIHNFFVDGTTEEEKHHLIAYYRGRNAALELASDHGSSFHITFSRELVRGGDVPHAYCPDIVEDANGRKYYLLKPESYIPEPIGHFIVLFCLGMLSRYYPDIWMRVIDENVRSAEMLDSLLASILRKFPNLILDQLSGIKHLITRQ